MQEFEIGYVDVQSNPDTGHSTAKFDVLVSGSTMSGDGRSAPSLLAVTVYLPTGSDDDQAQRALAGILREVARHLETNSADAGGLEAVVPDVD